MVAFIVWAIVVGTGAALLAGAAALLLRHTRL